MLKHTKLQVLIVMKVKENTSASIYWHKPDGFKMNKVNEKDIQKNGILTSCMCKIRLKGSQINWFFKIKWDLPHDMKN
jgi:hypothetical protein